MVTICSRLMRGSNPQRYMVLPWSRDKWQSKIFTITRRTATKLSRALTSQRMLRAQPLKSSPTSC